MDNLTPICPYCGQWSAKVGGAHIYPHRHDLHGMTFYACDPCGAWVGCHGTGTQPLGRLANAELRKAKQEAHRWFDQLWRDGYFTSRGAAYAWLAGELGVDGRDCHIGMFDVETCRRVADLAFNRMTVSSLPIALFG